MKPFASILALVAVSLSVTACYHHADKEKSDIAGIIPQQGSDDPFPAIEARYSNWPDPDTIFVTIGGERHKIVSSGAVYGPKGMDAFDLREEGRIERVYSVQKGKDLFLFYTDMTEEGMACYARRVDVETWKTVWKTDIPGVALGRPVVRGQFVYLELLGFVGKLKLKDGSFDWKYSGLNHDGKYEKFGDVKFPSRREVIFLAPHSFSQECDTIVINDLTGEIIWMN